MTTFAVSTNTNWHSLTGRTGSDVYNIGANVTLTIDGDTRYGPNTTPTTGPFTSVTNSSFNGCLRVDGRNVRLIPYDTGSGNVPAADTVISQGGVTGKLLGVWSALNVPPTAAGAAMPATGYIKVRQKAGGNYAAGTLTGIGANATGADVAGWIEVVGTDAGFIQGQNATCRVEILGEWFELGVTSGARNQTLQGPASLANVWYPGVYIETAVGSNVFAFWPSAGGTLNVAQDDRGKVVWCGSQGDVRIGHNGASDAGQLPAAGLRVVIGNVIWTSTNTTIGLGVNKDPVAASTGKFALGGNSGAVSGVYTVDKFTSNVGVGISASLASLTATYWAQLSNFQVVVSAPSSVTRSGVGAKAGTTGQQFQVSNTTAQLDFYDCVYAGLLPAAFVQSCNLAASRNVNFYRTRFVLLPAHATNQGGLFGNNVGSNSILEDCEFIGGTVAIPQNSVARRLKFADRIFGTVDAVQPITGVVVQSGSILDGLDWLIPTANTCHPYALLIQKSTDSKIRNIGSPASPLDLGTVNPCRGFYSSITGVSTWANNQVERCYAKNGVTIGLDGGGFTALNSRHINVGLYGATLAGVSYSTGPDCQYKGLNTDNGGSFFSQAGRPGTHFADLFYSDTSGRIYIFGSPPTAATVEQCVMSGGAVSSGLTTMYLFGVGARVEWTTHFIRGHTGFQNVAQVSNTGDFTSTIFGNCTVEYDLDKGSGFSGAWKAVSGANMSAETGIDPATGFRLRLRVTSLISTLQSFGYFFFNTTTTATDRYTLYPIDESTVTVSGLATGSRVKVTRVDTGALLYSGVESSGAVSFQTDYVGQIAIEARKASSAPYYQPWTTLATLAAASTINLTAVQLRDDQ